jgi:hypothetical protein
LVLVLDGCKRNGSGGIGAGVIASVVTAVNGHSVNDSVVADTGFMI